MFVCRLNDAFGVGYNPLEAFDDMMNTIMDNDGLEATEGIEPRDCEFFEHIEVNIQETKTWSIEPQYGE